MNNSKKYIKTCLISTTIIIAIAIAFKGFAQIALATKIGKSEIVTTNYLVNSSSSDLNTNIKSQESYKPNYKIVDSDKPTSLELNIEEASEIGVKSLYSIFGLDMNDKVIEMRYIPAENGRRAKWEGTFWVDGKKESIGSIVESYLFSVDSISGKLHRVGHDRVLEGSVYKGFDQSLKQNAQEYENLARELSVKIGAIQGEVKSAEYETQAVTSNRDATILIRVTGENGDEAILEFSRYDKELVYVLYDIYVKEMDAFNNAFDNLK